MVNLKLFQVQMKSLVDYSGNGMKTMLYLLMRTKMTNIRGHKNREVHFIHQARATPEAIIKAVVFSKKERKRL